MPDNTGRSKTTKTDTKPDTPNGPNPVWGAEQHPEWDKGTRHRKPGRVGNVKGKWTPTARAIFLERFAQTGVWYHSAHDAGLCGDTVRHYMKTDKSFAEEVERARQAYRELLENAAHRRAVHGVPRPIIGGRNKDQVVAIETVYSDGLLQFLMRANDREKYGDQVKVDNTHRGGVLVVSPNVTDSTSWEQMAALSQGPTGAVVQPQEKPQEPKS